MFQSPLIIHLNPRNHPLPTLLLSLPPHSVHKLIPNMICDPMVLLPIEHEEPRQACSLLTSSSPLSLPNLLSPSLLPSNHLHLISSQPQRLPNPILRLQPSGRCPRRTC